MPNKFIDMTGEKIGYWTVIKRSKKLVENGGAVWLCKCVCGRVKHMEGSYLRSGHSKSCGCYFSRLNREGRYFIDLAGKRFGKWTVLFRNPTTGKKTSAYWLCKCDCGTVKTVSSQSLRTGDTKSCGCSSRDKYKNKPLCPRCGSQRTLSYGPKWSCPICGRRWEKVYRVNRTREKIETPCSFCNSKTLASSGKFNFRCKSCGRVTRKPGYRIKYPKYFPPTIEESLNKPVLIL
jgi:tRNA(Ile2) C34 agmatinyltransferase TiaS